MWGPGLPTILFWLWARRRSDLDRVAYALVRAASPRQAVGGHFQTHAVDGLECATLLLRQSGAFRLFVRSSQKAGTCLCVDINSCQEPLQRRRVHAASLALPSSSAARARSNCARRCVIGGYAPSRSRITVSGFGH